MAHKKGVGSSKNGRESASKGRDHTLFALVDGTVCFKVGRNDRRSVSVVPAVEA